MILDAIPVGGVEVFLRNLFAHLDPDVVRPRVYCLREAGPLAEEFRAGGFAVEVVARSGPKGIARLPRLVAALRRDRIDAVLVAHHQRAGAGARSCGGEAGPRSSVGDPCPGNGLRVVWLPGASALGGRVAVPRGCTRLVSAAQGRYLHAEEGVGRHRWSSVREVVIANGIVVGPAPSRTDRAQARLELGLDDDEFVVGNTVARLSQEKAHHVLLQAMTFAGASPRTLRLPC